MKPLHISSCILGKKCKMEESQEISMKLSGMARIFVNFSFYVFFCFAGAVRNKTQFFGATAKEAEDVIIDYLK